MPRVIRIPDDRPKTAPVLRRASSTNSEVINRRFALSTAGRRESRYSMTDSSDDDDGEVNFAWGDENEKRRFRREVVERAMKEFDVEKALDRIRQMSVVEWMVKPDQFTLDWYRYRPFIKFIN